MSGDIWVWIRVPLSALTRAIAALKDSVIRNHYVDQRTEADRDEAAAEALKKSMREETRYGDKP